jgi:signal peptidase I
MLKEQSASTKRKITKGDILDTIVTILTALIIGVLIHQFIFERAVVDGTSMYPTLHNNQNIIVDKITPKINGYQRFDIVVLWSDGANEYLVKRIIGLPGETVQIKEGKVYINDEQLDDIDGLDTMISGGIAAEPIKLGDNEYFVLGDNRNNSLDSRIAYVGNIDISDIVGKMCF